MNRLTTYALLCMALLSLVACGDNGNEQPTDTPETPQAVNVRVITVEPQPLLDILTLPGQTEPVADVRVAAERAGAVEWMGVERGDAVTKGQPLARIDATTLAAARDRARADLRLATAKAERRRELFESKVLAREELDNAQTELTLARATLREAEAEYAKGEVSAPISGVIDELHVDAGEYVNEGEPVADIVDVSVIRIIVDVPELDVRFLHSGDSARVRVDAWPDRTWDGRIDFIASKADADTRTFRVRVVVANADAAIRPGMMARVSMVRREIPDAITAPLSVLLDRNGERILYVEKDGVAHARIITPGVLDGGTVQILEGLDAGDRLIVSGQAMVEEGTRVNVQ
ncbi:membrane fusion protein (multidrug efflux system) [Desulfobaculum xiamenense]|uniref:Membrane fusion protein (Multidrug efflux system) n=1 Tax=Desulfobaculum xiamenense TaxID=995050 RepID=A0A846QF71_9BACT|nr:efflux RND transporter periplasmic adaptor subunit [Desulfobaculum xiamenense]NJB67426.1 membrane fusion protein (multidrug efflux system) [Desulfobaculum xiamenense]